MEATTDYKEMWNVDLTIVYEKRSVQPQIMMQTQIMITAIFICSGLFYPTGWAAQPSSATL
jgi:hypothetical protein